jgi:hypothetical protein
MVLEETPEPLPGGLLVLTRLEEYSAFSRTSQGTCGLMAGDVIVEVNGQQGNASELREMLRVAFSASGPKVIEIVARSRPSSFNIELWRAGPHWRRLGVAATAVPEHPDSLMVKALHPDGLIPAWNTAHGSLRICKGDLITHINDAANDVDAMKKEVQKAKKGARLFLTIVTPTRRKAEGQKDASEDPEEGSWRTTEVPWDMRVRWLDDNTSDAEKFSCLSEMATLSTLSEVDKGSCRSEDSTACDSSDPLSPSSPVYPHRLNAFS